MTVLGAVAIKPFGVAKERLSTVLDSPTRARLGMAVAERTLQAVADAGATPAVVTGNDGVAEWAQRRGALVIRESAPGLDTAAACVIDAAGGRPWAFVHADLPLTNRPSEWVRAEFTKCDGSVKLPRELGETGLFAARSVSPVES